MNRLYKTVLGLAFLMTAHCLIAQPAKMVTIKVNAAPNVMLETDLYFMDTTKPSPVILLRTPYPRQQYRDIARFFTAQGYHMLVQSVRGAGGSTGQMVPFIYETADGLATLDYLEKQQWSNGNVGLFGASYSGFAGITLGTSGHKTLKAIVNLSGWAIPAAIAYPSGVNHLMMNIPWMLFNFSQGRLVPGKYNADSLLRSLPVNKMLALTGAPATFDQMQAPIRSMNQHFAYKDFSVPVMHVTGMYDFVKEGTMAMYDSLRKYKKTQKLLFGPWIHDQLFSNASKVGDYVLPAGQVKYGNHIMKDALLWFNHYMKNEPAKYLESNNYKLYPVWGDSAGLSFSDYPEKAIRTKTWYLEAGQGAQSLEGGGRLMEKKSGSVQTTDFISNPSDPVPTYGGANFHFFPENIGVKSQVEIEKRKDVLVFTGDVSSKDVLIVGRAAVHLYGSWDGKDCDYTAKLVAVDPENRAWIMSDAIARMSLTPKKTTDTKNDAGNKVYGFDIDLGHQNFLLKKGWKLRVEIAGSNFPKYERNAGTGENSTNATLLVPVKQLVWMGKSFPSVLTLETIAQ